MSAQELYTLMPYAALAAGSFILLILGAFAPAVGRRALCYTGAAFALSAAALAASGLSPSGAAGNLVMVDAFGRTFIAASSLAAFFVLLISVGYCERRPLGSEEYPALVLFAAFGTSLLASSTSLIGIFLGIESMSLALYVLVASNRSDRRSGEAGLKYLIIGAVSTAFFAYGLSLIYAATGTLSLATAMRAASLGGSINPLGLAGWAMLLVGLGFKASLFPFHFWAPDVYEGGPSPVVAFLSTASKASAFAVLLRLSTLYLAGWDALVPALWVVAALTMSFGNLAALTQDNIKRLLAYSSIAQMGYVLLALIAAPKSGGGAAVMFYLLAYMAMDMGAFGVVASFSDADGELGDIAALRGLGFRHPLRGLVLSLCLVSLAGLPPTAGFIGKLGIFYSSLKGGYAYLSVIGIITAIISVFYYLRVVVYLYMRAPEPGEPSRAMPALDAAGGAALCLLAAVIVYMGVMPGEILDMLSAALGQP